MIKLDMAEIEEVGNPKIGEARPVGAKGNPYGQEVQRLPNPEEMKADYQRMARKIVGVADGIIEENHLSGKSQSPNFYNLVHGDSSLLAKQLDSLAKTGTYDPYQDFGFRAHPDWLRAPSMMFDLKSYGMGLEKPLIDRYGEGKDFPESAKIASHNLGMEIAKRLGFFEGENTKRVERFGVSQGVKYDHPTEPFTVEFSPTYAPQNGQTRFERLTISHKNPVAAESSKTLHSKF